MVGAAEGCSGVPDEPGERSLCRSDGCFGQTARSQVFVEYPLTHPKGVRAARLTFPRGPIGVTDARCRDIDHGGSGSSRTISVVCRGVPGALPKI